MKRMYFTHFSNQRPYFIPGVLSQIAFVLLFLSSLSMKAQNQWAWMGGAAFTQNDNNVSSPMGRDCSSSWTDASGNFWLFGGFNNDVTYKTFNDLWKYDVQSSSWALISGSSSPNQATSVHGAAGQFSSGYYPGARASCNQWKDTQGNLWLFGGAYTSGPGSSVNYGDLWKFNLNSNMWAWMGDVAFNNPTYNTAQDNPGLRQLPLIWGDPSGNILWLYGGEQPGSSGNNQIVYNDLWKYTINTGTWTWVSGSSTPQKLAIYGTANDNPGSRLYSTAWIDAQGNLMLFGGRNYKGFDFNDVWRYDVSANTWAWIGGAKAANNSGVYGTLGVPGNTNIPGTRITNSSGSDSKGNMLLFGGNYLDDLWKYDDSSNQWAWISGDMYKGYKKGISAAQGVFAPSNNPGGREAGTSCMDDAGNFWLFGGYGTDTNGNIGFLGELWKYKSVSPTITSISPTSGPIGTLVKITGSNLDSPTAFSIGGANAIVISNDGNTLVGMVMPGATSGAVSVTTAGGVVMQGSYTVTAPVLPTAQQGQKIVPPDMIGKASLGYPSISADGNTVLIGGVDDNNFKGAAWVYTRSGTVWTEQAKLISPNAQLYGNFGFVTDLSADGNTAIIGASGENSHQGASYVFTRTGATWSLQTSLVETGSVNTIPILFGSSVAVSADGNTAVVGAPSDNTAAGALWVFKRNSNGWTQMGPKLTYYSLANLGASSVDISSDGKTIIAIGFYAYVFVEQNGIWVAQGPLSIALPQEVSISADGNWAVAADDLLSISGGGAVDPTGGFIYNRNNGVWAQPSIPINTADNCSISADGTHVLFGSVDDTYLYNRSGTTWTLAATLHGTSAIGIAGQVFGEISSDGQTAIVAGSNDNSGAGAFWIFSGSTPITPATSIISSTVSGQRTTEALVPITVKNFNNIVSSQFDITWDPTVATFVDVENFGLSNLTTAAFNVTQTAAGKLTLSWLEPALAPQTKTDGSALFSIRFTLTGNYGASTPVTISNAELGEPKPGTNTYQPVANVTTQAGTLSIDPGLTMNGTILYPNNGTIQNAQVGLGGSSTQSTSTDATGKYSFTIAPQTLTDSYSLTPSKLNDPSPLNGIDVQDIITIHRHVLGLQPLTNAYQLIAADVDNSGTVSTIDMVYIQALILGMSNNYPNNTFWTFVPSDYVFSDPAHPFPYPANRSLLLSDLELSPALDFTAIKLGDVDDSRDNTQQGRIASGTDITFDIRQEVIINDADNVIEIPIRVKDFENISGYQFTVTWDATKMEYVNAANQSTTSHFGESKTAQGMLTVLWEEPNGKSSTLGDKEELFVMRFKSSGGTYKDVNITSTLTPAKVYDKVAVSRNLAVTWSELDKEDYSRLTTLYPNPFEASATIEFYSEEAADGSIGITDALGRSILQQALHNTKGQNKMVWDGRDANGVLQPAGLYIVDLNVAGRVTRMKVVKKQ